MGTRSDDYTFKLLAGAVGEATFPPRLNTTVPATELGPAETPDAYGFDLTKDGLIGKGTIPTATDRITKNVTLTGSFAGNYTFHYKRLWRIDGTTLIVGAQNYDAAYYDQGPDIPFNEDSNPILDVVPCGPDFLFIAKSTGAYVLQNCGDSRGSILFQRTDLIQEMKVAAADRIVELNGNIYVANDKGLMFLNVNSLEATESTRAVRDSLTDLGFPSLVLKSDYQKRYVIGGSTFVMDTETGGIFRYSGNSFLYTSPKWHLPDYSPFNVDRLIFTIEHTSTSKGTLRYQVKLNDQDLGKYVDMPIPHDNRNETRTIIDWPLGDADRANARTFQLKITSISTGKYIKSIFVDGENLSFDDGWGA